MLSFFSIDFYVALSAGRTVLIVILLIIIAVRLRALCNYQRSHNLPPSPFQFPFLGCLPFLGELAHLTLSKWAKKFGKIYSCHFGGKLVVVLNDADVIKEAFGLQAFSGRPSMYTAEVTGEGYGIMFSSKWSLHRRFALKTFRSLGVGNNIVEERVQEESDSLIQNLLQLKGQPFDNRQLLQGIVGNVICSLLFGQQFDVSDPKTHEFYDRINLVSRFFGISGTLNIFPILRFIPAIGRAFQKVIKTLDCVASFIRNVIKEHEKNRNATGVYDYTEAFMTARNEEVLRYGKPQDFSDRQFIGAARELFMAGYDTTASTLRWAFLYMIKFPEIQAKVQQEIDEHTGRSRQPTFEDRKHLPFTQVVLNECSRMSTIAPLAVPHCAMEDTEFHGFMIPKGAWIVANIWHVHHDEKVWRDPQVFRPERFLSADQKQVLSLKEFMPFSIGKRACPGETLARMEVFLIFSRVLQQFTLEAHGAYDMTPLNGIALDTKTYTMIARSRANILDAD